MRIGIVGGGLAGLTSAILLGRQGHEVLLFEKKAYPFHRVCGEYISNEIKPFLVAQELYPNELNPVHIDHLKVSSPSGIVLEHPLEMGGFGISRFALDHFLVEKAKTEGIQVFERKDILEIRQNPDDTFSISTTKESWTVDFAIASYGKRSKLDYALDRDFIKKRAPFVGVKWHIRIPDFQKNNIELHNFEGGYCGSSKVENDWNNVCYLVNRETLRKAGSIPELESKVLSQNPFLKAIFNEGEKRWDRPQVINEIAFTAKPLIQNNVFMVGDSAGLIQPLCGNGMAMAIHAAYILSQSVQNNFSGGTLDWINLKKEYQTRWASTFQTRLRSGRMLSHLFGGKRTTNLAIKTLKPFPALTNFIVRKTHGKVVR
jgi:flavin-dependent dehydrogenase